MGEDENILYWQQISFAVSMVCLLRDKHFKTKLRANMKRLTLELSQHKTEQSLQI